MTGRTNWTHAERLEGQIAELRSLEREAKVARLTKIAETYRNERLALAAVLKEWREREAKFDRWEREAGRTIEWPMADGRTR